MSVRLVKFVESYQEKRGELGEGGTRSSRDGSTSRGLGCTGLPIGCSRCRACREKSSEVGGRREKEARAAPAPRRFRVDFEKKHQIQTFLFGTSLHFSPTSARTAFAVIRRPSDRGQSEILSLSQRSRTSLSKLQRRHNEQP